jgi:hypothetical protein
MRSAWFRRLTCRSHLLRALDRDRCHCQHHPNWRAARARTSLGIQASLKRVNQKRSMYCIFVFVQLTDCFEKDDLKWIYGHTLTPTLKDSTHFSDQTGNRVELACSREIFLDCMSHHYHYHTSNICTLNHTIKWYAIFNTCNKSFIADCKDFFSF